MSAAINDRSFFHPKPLELSRYHGDGGFLHQGLGKSESEPTELDR